MKRGSVLDIIPLICLNLGENGVNAAPVIMRFAALYIIIIGLGEVFFISANQKRRIRQGMFILQKEIVKGSFLRQMGI